MRAIKLQDVPPTKRPVRSLSLQDLLSELSRRPHRLRSKDEIDAQLREERASWAKGRLGS